MLQLSSRHFVVATNVLFFMLLLPGFGHWSLRDYGRPALSQSQGQQQTPFDRDGEDPPQTGQAAGVGTPEAQISSDDDKETGPLISDIADNAADYPDLEVPKYRKLEISFRIKIKERTLNMIKSKFIQSIYKFFSFM